MEQLKVKKKDVLVLNLMVFMGFSFIFLCLEYAYRHQLSPFSAAYFRKSLELFWYALVPLIIGSLLVWKHHRFSIFVYSLSVSLISYKVVEGLFLEFNKIIVIALFFYVVIAYFLYQLFSYYLSQANLNPNYAASDLFDPLLKELPCTLINPNGEYLGQLTNWDEEGCFIKLSQEPKLTTVGRIVINFKGRIFEQDGEIISQTADLIGVGIKFKTATKDLTVFNWSEFTELVHELGFKPERLR